MKVRLSPRDANSVPIEAEAMPFPNEETTPPVTKINLGIYKVCSGDGNADDQAGGI